MLFKVETAATLVEGAVERMWVMRLGERPQGGCWRLLAGDILLHHLGPADVGGQSGTCDLCFCVLFQGVLYTKKG